MATWFARRLLAHGWALASPAANRSPTGTHPPSSSSSQAVAGWSNPETLASRPERETEASSETRLDGAALRSATPRPDRASTANAVTVLMGATRALGSLGAYRPGGGATTVGEADRTNGDAGPLSAREGSTSTSPRS